MARTNVLVKISGDLFTNKEVIGWLQELAHSCSIVICVGGGTQINEAFQKRGFPVGRHGPLGRETKTIHEWQLARDVLEQNREALQKTLTQYKVCATVVIPFLEIGTVPCHINGDQFVKTAYLGFDRLYIVTAEEKVEEKQQVFKSFPKIEVRGFKT